AVNGRPAASAALAAGDRISLGAGELVVTFVAPLAQPSPWDVEERLRAAQARERELAEQAEQLETDRGIWYQRRAEVEAECRRQALYRRYRERRARLAVQRQAVRRAAHVVQERKRDCDAVSARLTALEEELGLRQAEVEARGEQVERERQLLDDQHRLLASRQ